MTDFAELVMGADTRGLKEALADLLALEKGSEKTEDSVLSLNKGLLALGGAAAGLGTILAVGVKHSINTADSYSKLSQRLGIAVKDLGALAHMADLSGSSVESLAMGVQFLSRNMAESLQSGTGAAAQAFKALGISVTDAKGNLRDSQDVLADLADRFANMPDGAQKTAAAMDLVGRGGAALIPLLNGGSAAMKDMQKEAEELGLVMSDDMAKASEEFNDNMDRVKAGLEGVFNIIAAQVVPSLAKMSADLVSLTKDGVKFFSENLDTVATVLEHALIAATSLAVFMAGKFAVSLATTAVGAITSTVSSMVALEMALGATSTASALTSIAIKGFSAALGTLKGALITTGIGVLVVAAGELVALLIDLKDKTGSWGAAFGLVGDVALGVLKDIWANLQALGQAYIAFYSGIAKGALAAIKGGSFKEAFLAEFKDIEFGATNTTEAIAKMMAALNNNPSTSEPTAPGAPKPAPGPVGPPQDVIDQYNKLVKALQDQTIEMGLADRAAAIYKATSELAAGSTQAMKDRVAELAGALFDATKKHDEAKATADSYKSTMDELNKSIEEQFASLYKTDEQIAVDNALRKVSGKLTDEQVKKLTQQAKTEAALKKEIDQRNKLERAAADLKHDVATKQQLLNEKLKEYGELLAGGFINQAEFDKAVEKAKKDLNIDTRSIGEKMWDGLKATFFDPFKEGAEGMADKFAEQVDRMSNAANRMANGKSVIDKLQGGLDVLANIPGPIGAVSGAISKAISVVKSVVGIVKSIGKALFGGSWQTTGGGIQLQLGAQGVLGQTFETQHKSGGLFSSSKDRTLYSAIGSDQAAQFNTAYQNILTNATNAFQMFGISASRDMMEQVRIAALNIKTSGEGALSESAAQAAIEDWFKQLDSAIVNAVGTAGSPEQIVGDWTYAFDEFGNFTGQFPTVIKENILQPLLDLATEGESATETLIRLGNQMNMTNTLLDSLGLKMYDVGISGGVMADSLVKLAGGMDKFQAGVNAFFQYFYTADEQFEQLTKNLTASFTELGLTLPDTRQGIRDIVAGLDLTTEAGQKAFAMITGSSEALNAYYTHMEEMAKAAAEAGIAASDATTQAAIDAANAITQAAIDAANAAKKATDTAFDALKQSIDAEKALRQTAHNEAIAQIQAEGKARTDAANAQLTIARNTLSALQSEVSQINSALANAKGQLNPRASASNALAFIRTALQTGNLTGTGAAAQTAIQGLDQSNFASSADFKRAQIKTVNLLTQLSDKGAEQINYAQLTIDSINNQIVAIQASTAELIDAETAFFNQQMDNLDDQLEAAQNSLNELRGIKTGVASVETALRDFNTALQAEIANSRQPPPGVGGGTTPATNAQQTAAATLAALNSIVDYSRATATATTKDYNLNDRIYRDAQAEETV